MSNLREGLQRKARSAWTVCAPDLQRKARPERRMCGGEGHARERLKGVTVVISDQ
jgi:hypothetical protein